MKLLPSILATSLLLGATPALAVNPNALNPCTQSKITDRLACQRLIERSQAIKNSTTRDYIRANSSILKNVHSNRRSDRNNNASSISAKQKNEAEALTRFELRRAKTLERKQTRLNDAKERSEKLAEKKQLLLRNRINSMKTKVINLTKEQVRKRINTSDAISQRRRNALSQARKMCREEVGADKIACIKEQRDLLIKAQEEE
ncbi:MAG: hypothetical protein KAS32_17570 [Candidatus Peribacteraceae bacterium]|nr:hypothetical protein [Candidatus Peribacteraceae bacterium]